LAVVKLVDEEIVELELSVVIGTFDVDLFVVA
jgi:hypothetical protein